MIRLTFQFIPSKFNNSAEVEVNYSSNRIDHIEKLDGGLRFIHLKSGHRLEYDVSGDIRYSIDVEGLSKHKLYTTYESAQKAIRDVIILDRAAYNVCLILHSQKAVSVYLDSLDDIGEFATHEFNNSNPTYTELGDQTIKLSFGQDGHGIVI